MAQAESALSYQPTPTVPVVCIGLSVGGLEPLQTIFRHLSSETGYAFVVISHVSRTEPSWLPWLLKGWSKMPNEVAQEGMVLKPNHIYTIPSGKEIKLQDGHFAVDTRSKARGYSNVVTLFLDSMAKPYRAPGIAVILSGMDSDGAEALRDFHSSGGTTIVQEVRSASHSEMPKSAIATGFVDFQLPPEAIAHKIEEIARRRTKSQSQSV